MPRKEEDKTLRSQGPGGASRGAETQEAALRAGTEPAAAIPVQFPTMEDPVPEEPDLVEAPADESLDIPGLGNLGDILFADGAQEFGLGGQAEPMFSPAGPRGPSQEYQRLLRDPRVSDGTRALISLVSRLQMLQGR